MKYRDLETVRQIIDEATGLEVSYAYDDLVFPDHTAFIIQYDDEDQNKLFCHFHKDCQGKDREKLINNLTKVTEAKRMKLVVKKQFELEQVDEEVRIVFSN